MIAQTLMREIERIWVQITSYFPYVFIWHWKKWRGKTDGTVIYLQFPIHYVMFESMHIYLPNVRIVAGNKKTSQYLESRGIEHSNCRLYPDVVILADYCQNRYPIKSIKKIQIYHEVGTKNHFYRKGNKDIYYLVPGHYAANKLKAQGKEKVFVVGYPKTDRFFTGEWSKEEICRRIGADTEKKTVLYTPTWGKHGTALKLYEYISKLGERYNLIVKLHDKSPEEWSKTYRKLPNIIYCEDADPTPYQFVADLLISDFSSTIFEYAQLKRPVIAFGVSDETLRKNATDPKWWDITCRVSDPDDLESQVEKMLASNWRPNEVYLELITDIFYYNDGKCAKRAADIIGSIVNYSEAKTVQEHSVNQLGEAAATFKRPH